jgi:hypothetical protein
MAVAQPADGKAIEVLGSSDRTAGERAQIASQMHNAGLSGKCEDAPALRTGRASF